MRIDLVPLSSLRQRQLTTGQDSFVRAFPGAFLLAMGLVSAEVIRARKKPGKDSRDATCAIQFGSRLRHDSMAPHPLAGMAFFVSPAEDRKSIVLGRGANCDVTIPEASVSEQHCCIEVTDEGVMAIDLRSTNGTTINLERLQAEQPRLLADEDILTLGRYSFQMLSAETMYAELGLLNEMEA